MTQSGIKPLIPDISGSNYIDPIDVTASLEENTKDSISNYNSYIDGMIAQSNAMNKIAESKNKQLLQLTGQGVKFYQWHKAQNEAKQFAKSYLTEGDDIEVREKQQFDAVNIAAEGEVIEAGSNERYAEATGTAKQLGLNWYETKNLIHGATPHRPSKEILYFQGRNLAGTYRQLEQKYQFRDTHGNWTTLALVDDPINYERGLAAIRVFIAQEAQQSVGNDRLIRQILVPQMLKLEASKRSMWNRNQQIAHDAAQAVYEQDYFAEQWVNKGGHGYQAMMDRTKGKYLLPNGKYDWVATRQDVVNQAIELIKANKITSAEVESLETYVPPYPPGAKKPFSELYPKEYDRIKAAINVQNSENHKNRELEQTNALNSWWVAKQASWAGKETTPKMAKEAEAEANREFGRLPEGLKRVLIQMESEPREAYQALEQQSALGIPIEDSQVWSITDPKYQKQALELQKTSISSTAKSQMNTFIQTATKDYVGGNYGKQDIMPMRAGTVSTNATKIYAAKYRQQRALGQPHDVAVQAAEKAVMDVMNSEPGSPKRVALETRWQDQTESSAPNNLKKSIVAIKNDYSIIDSEQPLPGEEDALKLAQKWYKNGGRIPDYYIQLAKNLQNFDAKGLMDHRWKLAGGKVEETLSDKTLNSMNMWDRKNLINFPTPSKTLLTYENNEENADKLLEIAKSEVAQANGGYDYILSPAGGDAHLEKPLSEHTVGEVLDLILSGHTNIGMYDLSKDQLVEALEGTENNWDLDTVFNSEFQDKLMKGRLRRQSNKQSISTGVDVSWRSLVNIDEESKLAFQEQTGITSPYLQLETMPQEIATVFLEESLVV